MLRAVHSPVLESQRPKRSYRPRGSSLPSRLLVGAFVGLLAGTFFAVIIALVALVVMLAVPGAARVWQAAGLLILINYAVAVITSAWRVARRRTR